MADQKSTPVIKGGRQTATILPSGLVVKDKGGKGAGGVIGSAKPEKK